MTTMSRRQQKAVVHFGTAILLLALTPTGMAGGDADVLSETATTQGVCVRIGPRQMAYLTWSVPEDVTLSIVKDDGRPVSVVSQGDAAMVLAAAVAKVRSRPPAGVVYGTFASDNPNLAALSALLSPTSAGTAYTVHARAAGQGAFDLAAMSLDTDVSDPSGRTGVISLRPADAKMDAIIEVVCAANTPVPPDLLCRVLDLHRRIGPVKSVAMSPRATVVSFHDGSLAMRMENDHRALRLRLIRLTPVGDFGLLSADAKARLLAALPDAVIDRPTADIDDRLPLDLADYQGSRRGLRQDPLIWLTVQKMERP